MDSLVRVLKILIPPRLFAVLQPYYHYCIALVSALVYRFPSRRLRTVGVTGTKGKSTVTEMINAVLEEAGYTTALSNTIRFKIGGETKQNFHKMTMPGRFFTQRFLRRAVTAGCDWAILEMTSEGVRQHRHRWIALDGLVFTNLSPEHIESHGSYEKYRDAKRKLGTLLARSTKKDTTIVANADDPEASWYLELPVRASVPFTLKNAGLLQKKEQKERGHAFTFRGTRITLHLPGIFNVQNALAAATFAAHIGIQPDSIKRGLEKIKTIRGRVEFVQREPFAVVVDYAHTIDSLEKFYGAFADSRNICVLGNTGGGRDAWKRPKMATVAEKHCAYVILTNEDPYDEDPNAILDEMARGVSDTNKLETIIDRRQAIAHALTLARPGDSVLITGKGTDPYIMGPHGSKQSWDDATVAREELEKLSERSTKNV